MYKSNNFAVLTLKTHFLKQCFHQTIKKNRKFQKCGICLLMHKLKLPNRGNFQTSVDVQDRCNVKNSSKGNQCFLCRGYVYRKLNILETKLFVWISPLVLSLASPSITVCAIFAQREQVQWLQKKNHTNPEYLLFLDSTEKLR